MIKYFVHFYFQLFVHFYIDFNKITLGSNKKVWWICNNGHEWQAVVSSRTLSNASCPYCSNRKTLSGFNDLVTLNYNLSLEWNYKKNQINPKCVSPNSHEHVWWKCSKCEYEWEALISSRNFGAGCPKCTNRIKKKVVQYDKEYHVINQYDSISEASKNTGIHTTSISNVCKGNAKTAGNYYWKYLEDEK